MVYFSYQKQGSTVFELWPMSHTFNTVTWYLTDKIFDMLQHEIHITVSKIRPIVDRAPTNSEKLQLNSKLNRLMHTKASRRALLLIGFRFWTIWITHLIQKFVCIYQIRCIQSPEEMWCIKILLSIPYPLEASREVSLPSWPTDPRKHWPELQ